MTWTTIAPITDERGFSLQTTHFGDFVIEQLKSPLASVNAEFLPVRVLYRSSKVWSFRDDHKRHGFEGMAFLREIDDELVIVLVQRKKLFEVIPVLDLADRKRIGDEYVGGRKLKKLVELKQRLADDEGMQPIWSQREEALQKAITKMANDARHAALQATEAEILKRNEEQRVARERKRAEILARHRLFVYTLSGERRFGHPVVNDEWLSLGDGCYCVAVTSYDSTNGAAGEPIEAFWVKKDGTRKERRAVVAVTSHPPAAKPERLQKVQFLTVPIKGEPEEVILVQNMGDIRYLHEQGLNKNTLVMCPKAGDEGRFSVFMITANTIESVTEVIRKR
jgi:hypothetical protein